MEKYTQNCTTVFFRPKSHEVNAPPVHLGLLSLSKYKKTKHVEPNSTKSQNLKRLVTAIQFQNNSSVVTAFSFSLINNSSP